MKSLSPLVLFVASWSATFVPSSAFYWGGGRIECKNNPQGTLCAYFEAVWWNPPAEGPPPPGSSSQGPSQLSSNTPMASPISSYPTTPNTSGSALYWTQYNYVSQSLEGTYCPYPPPITTIYLELTYSNQCKIIVDGTTCNSCTPCGTTSYEEQYTYDCTNIPFGRKTSQCESGQRGQLGGEFLRDFFFPLTSESPAVEVLNVGSSVPTLHATTTSPASVPVLPSPTNPPTLTATSYAPSFVGQPSVTSSSPSIEIPSYVPSSLVPSYVPSSLIPSYVPSSLIPSYVPSSLIPSYVPESLIPSSIPGSSDVPSQSHIDHFLSYSIPLQLTVPSSFVGLDDSDINQLRSLTETHVAQRLYTYRTPGVGVLDVSFSPSAPTVNLSGNQLVVGFVAEIFWYSAVEDSNLLPLDEALQSGDDADLLASVLSAVPSLEGSTNLVWLPTSFAISEPPTPFVLPTVSPTTAPPTNAPVASPTLAPTNAPIALPADKPVTEAPVLSPTAKPTTKAPVATPTDAPTPSPTNIPVTEAPVVAPTDAPIVSPTGKPTPPPSKAPAPTTETPVATPTDAPTASPTNKTEAPVVAPTDAPIVSPTEKPIVVTPPPSKAPASLPTTSAPTTPSPTSMTAPASDSLTLMLVNPKTNADVAPIRDGSTIDKGSLGFSNWNVRLGPQASPEGVKSVEFRYDGKTFRVENVAPFALVGDRNGDYFDWWSPTAGEQHTITATAYDAYGASGNQVGSVSVKFTVIDASKRHLRAARS